MNVLNVYQNPDLIGGSERAMHLGTDALLSAGHHVFLLHGATSEPKSAGRYAGHASVSQVWSRSPFPPNLSEVMPVVRSLLERWKIDVIHLHDSPRPVFLRQLGSLRPLVITLHVATCPNGARYFWKKRQCCERSIGIGCFTVGYLRMGCGRLANGRRWSVRGFAYSMYTDNRFRSSLKYASRVLVSSAWHKRRMIADGVPEKSLRLIPPPIPNGSAAPAPVYHPELPPALVFVGRFVDFKGADHLLRASALIRQPHRIWLIGDGPGRASLERLAMDSGIGERVTFFGELSADVIDSIRSKAAVVVFPSLLAETFGLVGPEGMLLGLPVVAYNIGGIPDWLDDGVNGTLVEPGNIPKLTAALDALLENPDQAARMGAAGHRIAGKWSVARYATQLEAVFKKALEEWRELPHPSP